MQQARSQGSDLVKQVERQRHARWIDFQVARQAQRKLGTAKGVTAKTPGLRCITLRFQDAFDVALAKAKIQTTNEGDEQ